ncbi:hypothetical protein FXF51_32095 [Nonomuraea sp. PA05]|uniref:hypothetical protein n=1 Tax=Nonomuraea sp. PA05 TaxID=2604466 RepID=UPI0011D42FBC|nr:hypothetical protein [Nonomuraea sp. PA05]TYB60236.1 hypothetical protein FXF51_32095 [Nonomuraea sp. PA05]
MSRLLRALALPLAVVLGAVLLASAPASAGVLDVTCTPPSTTSAVYNPPLTLTPQPTTVTLSDQYGPCVSVSVPALSSGSAGSQFPVAGLSCLELLQPSSFTSTITWNTGQTSTFSGNTTAEFVGAALVVTSTGTVTSGLFAGDTVLRVVTVPDLNITLCTLGLAPVASHTGSMMLEFTTSL